MTRSARNRRRWIDQFFRKTRPADVGELECVVIFRLPCYFNGMTTEFLLPGLPVERICAGLGNSPGNEIGSGKIASLASSAALAVNTFGYFLEKPANLPAIPGTEIFGWPAEAVAIEVCVRFPWQGGRHPWLDAYVETPTHIIGVESKRFEPYRAKNHGAFSEAYWRPVWGNGMAPFENMRNRLHDESLKPKRLDAVQLVKHAFGLRTQADKNKKSAVLDYLYAEPERWPDGRAVHDKLKRVHSEEIQQFAFDVSGAEVEFRACTYKDLLRSLAISTDAGIRKHGQAVTEKFSL